MRFIAGKSLCDVCHRMFWRTGCRAFPIPSSLKEVEAFPFEEMIQSPATHS